MFVSLANPRLAARGKGHVILTRLKLTWLAPAPVAAGRGSSPGSARRQMQRYRQAVGRSARKLQVKTLSLVLATKAAVNQLNHKIYFEIRIFHFKCLFRSLFNEKWSLFMHHCIPGTFTDPMTLNSS